MLQKAYKLLQLKGMQMIPLPNFFKRILPYLKTSFGATSIYRSLLRSHYDFHYGWIPSTTIPHPPTYPSTAMCMPNSTKTIPKISLTSSFYATFGVFLLLAPYVVASIGLLVMVSHLLPCYPPSFLLLSVVLKLSFALPFLPFLTVLRPIVFRLLFTTYVDITRTPMFVKHHACKLPHTNGHTSTSTHKTCNLQLGASMVKWTAPDPCLVLSESDSILCLNFEFCEEKTHRHSKNILIYKAKQFMMTKRIPRKVYLF